MSIDPMETDNLMFFDFSRDDLCSDIRQILKIQLHNTAVLYNAEAIDRMLFPGTDGYQFMGDLDWDRNLTHLEENIDLNDSLMAEAILEIYDFANGSDPSQYWLDESDKEYSFGPIQGAIPKCLANGDVPQVLAPESRVNKLLNFANAVVKIGIAFRDTGSLAPLFSVSELASLANTSLQIVRNALSLENSPLKALRTSDGHTGISFEDGIKWRNNRRNFTPFPIKLEANSAAREITLEGANGRTCPVYVLALHWNLGPEKEIAQRLGLSTGKVSEILALKSTNDPYLLSNIGKALGLKHVEHFIELAQENYTTLYGSRDFGELEDILFELVRDLDGNWSRPYVTDGNPYKVDGAIIGLNPATPISTKMPKQEFSRLIKDRDQFERHYTEIRRQRGKSELSRTRNRLGFIVDGLPAINFAETNINSLPTKNGQELDRSPHRRIGAEIAEAYLRKIQPKIVIIHHADTLNILKNSDFVFLGEEYPRFDTFAKLYPHAFWNGQPTLAISIPGLAAREKGWSDDAIRKIVEKVNRVVKGEIIDEIIGGSETVSNVVETVGELVDTANGSGGWEDAKRTNLLRTNSWLDLKVQAIKNVSNPFTLNTKRWKRHDLLLEYRDRLSMREYCRLLVENGLPRASKKYIRAAIDHKCIRIFDEDERVLTKSTSLALVK
jgi:hypothetical protein